MKVWLQLLAIIVTAVLIVGAITVLPQTWAVVVGAALAVGIVIVLGVIREVFDKGQPQSEPEPKEQ
jgi:heme A synthase